MNGIDNPILFYTASCIIIFSAILTIYFRNIFYSLISAIIVFLMTGVLFYILGSEYNAIVQVAIYGVAVPIILGIAIMFTNLKNNIVENNNFLSKYLIFLFGIVFILAFIYLALTSYAIMPVGFNLIEKTNSSFVSTISSFGNGLFVRYVWAFEIVSLVLTIVVVGLTLFRRDKCKK